METEQESQVDQSIESTNNPSYDYNKSDTYKNNE